MLRSGPASHLARRASEGVPETAVAGGFWWFSLASVGLVWVLATHSVAEVMIEARASSKNLARILRCRLPFPSAMLLRRRKFIDEKICVMVVFFRLPVRLIGDD